MNKQITPNNSDDLFRNAGYFVTVAPYKSSKYLVKDDFFASRRGKKVVRAVFTDIAKEHLGKGAIKTFGLQIVKKIQSVDQWGSIYSNDYQDNDDNEDEEKITSFKKEAETNYPGMESAIGFGYFAETIITDDNIESTNFLLIL